MEGKGKGGGKGEERSDGGSLGGEETAGRRAKSVATDEEAAEWPREADANEGEQRTIELAQRRCWQFGWELGPGQAEQVAHVGRAGDFETVLGSVRKARNKVALKAMCWWGACAVLGWLALLVLLAVGALPPSWYVVPVHVTIGSAAFVFCVSRIYFRTPQMTMVMQQTADDVGIDSSVTFEAFCENRSSAQVRITYPVANRLARSASPNTYTEYSGEYTSY